MEPRLSEILPELKDLDSTLKCGICYDFMHTTLIIPNCSHNYCSLCIRKYFTFKQQCPICSEKFFENDLKSNRILDDIIRLYSALRPKILDLMRPSSDSLKPFSSRTQQIKEPVVIKVPTDELSVKKNDVNDLVVFNVDNDEDDDDFNQSFTSTKFSSQTNFLKSPSSSSSSLSLSKNSSSTKVPSSAKLTSPKSSTWEILNLKKSKTMAKVSNAPTPATHKAVPCPVCESLIHPININSHLDQCLKKSSSSNSTEQCYASCSASTSIDDSYNNTKNDKFMKERLEHDAVIITNTNVNIRSGEVDEMDVLKGNATHLQQHSLASFASTSSSHQQLPKRKPLTKLVFNVMSDKEIRKRLVEYGLPTNGDKQKLINRLQEYRLLYNAECDALEPKPVSEIAKEVMRMESQRGVLSPIKSLPSLNINKSSTAEQVENAQKLYVKKHKSQFAELIKAAKKNWKAKESSASNCGSISENVTAVSTVSGGKESEGEEDAKDVGRASDIIKNNNTDLRAAGNPQNRAFSNAKRPLFHNFEKEKNFSHNLNESSTINQVTHCTKIVSNESNGNVKSEEDLFKASTSDEICNVVTHSTNNLTSSDMKLENEFHDVVSNDLVYDTFEEKKWITDSTKDDLMFTNIRSNDVELINTPRTSDKIENIADSDAETEDEQDLINSPNSSSSSSKASNNDINIDFVNSNNSNRSADGCEKFESAVRIKEESKRGVCVESASNYSPSLDTSRLKSLRSGNQKKFEKNIVKSAAENTETNCKFSPMKTRGLTRKRKQKSPVTYKDGTDDDAFEINNSPDKHSSITNAKNHQPCPKRIKSSLKNFSLPDINNLLPGTVTKCSAYFLNVLCAVSYVAVVTV
ncbi:hypothetical protein HELRODRAFT_189827 [Helobdella robusta]|uniref:RING-type E3 ubiquitin transferase n=1 Tax=Helobdella robusta TaxID=6412 RepID=T1FRE5_HELRO|nr:hypothetical protein HELRODRAFT_189827 [Helobdella robusta]ESN90297.1 hypothetical protein HELRODRAFT_189827 [Helobdella robusta]